MYDKYVYKRWDAQAISIFITGLKCTGTLYSGEEYGTAYVVKYEVDFFL